MELIDLECPKDSRHYQFVRTRIVTEEVCEIVHKDNLFVQSAGSKLIGSKDLGWVCYTCGEPAAITRTTV